MRRYNHPTALVIFGGTGNLAETKLIPSLFNLYTEGLLPEKLRIIGVSRKALADTEYQAYVRNIVEKKCTPQDVDSAERFYASFSYFSGSFDDENTYAGIKELLLGIDAEFGQCASKLFYLAVPPQLYSGIFAQVSTSGIMSLCGHENSWSRLLVEKPFGKDLETAEALEEQLRTQFLESQVYRIDHYLEKDAIENILSLRFANSILADSWNKERIESITIRLLEDTDVSRRGSFYDDVGALRDVGQNHMLQIFALLTMERADITDPLAVRTARAKALSLLRRSEAHALVRAQYVGFTDAEGVGGGSETETYFKFEAEVDASLWNGVLFNFESGKALSESKTEAVIVFKPIGLCTCAHDTEPHEHRNMLRITFSPNHEMSLTMWVNEAGFIFKLKERNLVLVAEEGVPTRSPEAYERVLYDCIVGDQTRFVSGGEVVEAWKFITPILEKFTEIPLGTYERGSRGL